MAEKNKKNIPEILTWKAPSHEQHKRSFLWYIGFVICSVALIMAGVLTHSITTLITFCLVVLCVGLFSTIKPQTITYKATKTGITIGTTIYPYKVIRLFWIVYNPPTTKTVNFQTTAYLNNRLILQLGDQDPVTVKLFLKQYLPEDIDRGESMNDVLARTLKI